MIKKFMIIGAAVAVLAISGAAQVTASVLTFTLAQSGSNVFGTVSGSVDTTKLSIGAINTNSVYLWASMGYIAIGGTSSTNVRAWGGLTGPESFGAGSWQAGAASSGDAACHVGVSGTQGAVFLPTNYTAGALLSGTSTWNDTTLSDRGITPGTYTWTYNGGADSIVLQAGDSPAVPEPAFFQMGALLGMSGLGCLKLRRKA